MFSIGKGVIAMGPQQTKERVIRKEGGPIPVGEINHHILKYYKASSCVFSRKSLEDFQLRSNMI